MNTTGAHSAILATALSITALLAMTPTLHAEITDLSGAGMVQSFDITFSGYSGSETLADFPVLVRLSPTLNGFDYSRCRADGSDIRFIDASGNPLAREIDTWTPGGESLVWVKVPSLTAATTITCLYGFAGAAPGSASDVWSNGYAAVWHLGESALPLKESSGASTPFSVSSNLTAAAFSAAGKVGGAVDFTQTEGGTRPWLSAEDDDDLDGFGSCTVEVWTKRGAGADGNKFVLSKREAGGGGIAYSVYQSKTDYAVMQITLDDSTAETILEGNATKGNMKFDQDKWVHQAYVRDVGAVAAFGYVDGDCTGTKTLASVSSLYVSSGPLYLGNRNYNRPEAYNGQIDEVRISRVARSAAWVKASHDTVADDTFARYSAVRANNDTFVIVVR